MSVREREISQGGVTLNRRVRGKGAKKKAKWRGRDKKFQDDPRSSWMTSVMYEHTRQDMDSVSSHARN